MTRSRHERRTFSRIAFDAKTELSKTASNGRCNWWMYRSKGCWCKSRAMDWHPGPDLMFSDIHLDAETHMSMQVRLSPCRQAHKLGFECDPHRPAVDQPFALLIE
jgi:hypothetical protein